MPTHTSTAVYIHKEGLRYHMSWERKKGLGQKVKRAPLLPTLLPVTPRKHREAAVADKAVPPQAAGLDVEKK